MTEPMTLEREAFEKWFYASKYAQVALPTSRDGQRAWDAWEARAHLAQQAQAWQPITTAPKDGTLALVWNGDFLTIATWDGKLARWIDYCENSGSVDFDDPPTHWMPLPDPPASPTPDKEGL